MATATYNPNYKQGLNKARLNVQSLQSEIEKAQSNIGKTKQSAQKTAALWKGGQRGAAISEMADASQYLADQYDLNKSNLNLARMQATTQEVAGGAGKIVSAAENARLLKALWESTKLGVLLRKKINDHDNIAFMFILSLSILSDFSDLLPFIGTILSACITVIIVIAMFGRGLWKKKLFIKIILLVLLGLDCIPIIEILPWTTIGTILAWRASAKEAREAKKELIDVEQKIPDLKAESENDYNELVGQY
ncbi:MAG: hypothetical protein OEV93_04150 [Candidatus Moranbacteria bacterium]|nr:hypothetical protein [Candidatus Moranbacteria bacterium]